MKKVFAVVLMVIMLASALSVVAACGFEDDELTVVFYHTMGEAYRAVLDKYIVEFNKIYPNITIDHSQVGGYPDVRDKVSQELIVGEGPSMAYCYPDHVALFDLTKQVVNLYDYMNSTEVIEAGSEFGNKEEVSVGMTKAEVDNFIDGYLKEGIFTAKDGSEQMLAFPFSKSTEVLYYNAEFFEANKDVIEVPTHWWCPETGHENCKSSMEYVCAKIKEIDPYATPLGYDSEANWFITMCEQLGTGYTTIDPVTSPVDSSKVTRYAFYNDDNQSFLTRFNTWYYNGWVTTQEIFGDYTSGLFTETTPEKNKSYMSIGSSAGAKHQRPAKEDGEYPFTVGITTIPQANENNKKVISQGPSVCMIKSGNSEKKLMATWLFVKYLTTNVDFQIEFAEAGGYIPVLESATDPELAKTSKVVANYINTIEKADGGDNIVGLAAKVCMAQKDYYYTSPAFVGSSQARDQVGILMQKVLTLDLKTLGATGVATEIEKALEAAFMECESQAKTPQPSK